jgi:uncharacterized phage protein gp47/JayE
MDFKTYEQLKNTAISNATANLPELDSTTDPVILTLVESVGGSTFSLQNLFIDLIEDVIFPQTAAGAFLSNIWGAYENLFPLAATPSLGYINVSSSDTVALDTEYTIDGLVFTTQESSVDVSGTYYASYTTSGTTVTATVMDSTYLSEVPHYLGTGMSITIPDTVNYDGEHEITVTGESTFTFTVDTGVSDFNGEYSISDSEYVLVQCTTTGTVTNLSSGELQAAAAGSTDVAYITYEGLTGGASAETDSVFRERILTARSLVEGDFTNGQILLAALSINGNTRVFIVNPTTSGTGQPEAIGSYAADVTDNGDSTTIKLTTTTPHYLVDGTEITIDDGDYAGTYAIDYEDANNFNITVAYDTDDTTTYTYSREQFEAANKGLIPVPGVVYMFILRDDDSTITPSEAILDLTKTAVLNQGKLPSHTPQENVVLFAPTLSYLSFEITNLLPNTDTMKAAINTQLKAFFEDNANLSTAVAMDAVRAAIWETEDLVNNERVTSFTLSQYGQQDDSVISPDTPTTGVLTIAISQGSIPAYDDTDGNSLTFVTT